MHKISLVLLAICLQANDIRISEVMSNPQGSEYENEFIEVYNSSDHVTHINGWLLSDGTGVDSIFHFYGPTEIQAGAYAVILDPGYNYVSGPYAGILPDSIPIYSISTDASFGSGGLANSSESVMIWSPDSLHFSQMSWSSASENGYSWERVSLDVADSLAIWRQSLVENGSPGFRNSVQQAEINLSLSSAIVTYSELGEPIELLLSLDNTGSDEISNFSISIYHDQNQDGIQEPGEWELSVEPNLTLLSEQSIDYPITLFSLEPGVHYGLARLILNGDQINEDDSLWFEAKGAYPKDALSLTEIMFSPTMEQGGEWIELKNVSSESISLQGWTFSDANQTRHSITDQLFLLKPDCLLTLCADQDAIEYFELAYEEVLLLDSWPTLNASSDSIRLFDATGHAVSSGFYRGSWGAAGVSLERRHPLLKPMDETNWAICLKPEGGTPSRSNSQQLRAVDLELVSIESIQQPAVGPAQLNFVVRFVNQGLDSLFLLELESDADIEWRGALASFQTDSLVFSSPMMWPGYSVLPIRLLHDGQLLADTLVQVVLGFPPNSIALNEIHYLPGEDQVEFLEFINTGAETLNPRGWMFMDRSGVFGSIEDNAEIEPGAFFLMCQNAAILADWVTENTVILEPHPWPTLNNSSDSIFIQDPFGNLHIIHGYDATHGSEPGKSLERLALWKPENLAESWDLCQDPLGSTPGRQNSVTLPPRNLALDNVEISNSIVWIDEPFSLDIIIINTGVDMVEGTRLSIQTYQGSVQLSEQQLELMPIYAQDTLVLGVELVIQTAGWVDIRAEIVTSDDLFADNWINRRLFVSIQTTPLIINEIYPLPQHEQSEWVEIYNRGAIDRDIQGWSIADNTGTAVIISDTSLVLAPGSYLVLSSPAESLSWFGNIPLQMIPGFPMLNNSRDAVVLFDPNGIQMDGLYYDEFTGLVEGRSLERIRPDAPGSELGNWGVCVDLAASTPGLKNSLYLTTLAADLEIHLEPNPFTPDGDGERDELMIQYDLPIEHGVMSITIFDMAGRRIAEPIQVMPVSHKGHVVWDGAADYGGIAVTGLYVMQLLVDDQAGRVWKDLQKVYLIR